MAVDLPVATGPLVDVVEPTRAVPAAAAVRRDPEPRGPCGGVLVRVITASSDPEWAFATIADGPGKPARMRRVGDPVANWRIDSIEWDRVWLHAGGTRCAAGIHDGAREARVAVGLDPDSEGPLQAADDDAPPWHVPPDVAGAIRQRSATEFVIDERAIARIFERGPELLAGVQFEPVKEGGVVGVSLDSIPTHSLLDRLGIEKGDIVLALNDRPVVTLDAAIAALGDARTRSALVASLQRGGQDFAIDVAISK
jgi:general secretion pathway protein C